MVRHELTPKETEKGWKASAKARRALARLAKKELSIKSSAQWFDLIKAGLASPAIAGTTAYFVVTLLNTHVRNPAPPTPTPTPGPLEDLWTAFMTGFSKSLSSTLGPLGDIISSALGTKPTGDTHALWLSDLDAGALKAALIAYIATGGNLAGTLQGGASFATALLAAVPK